MTEAIVLALAEWLIRATILAALAAALLFVFRIRSVHVRLATWTAVLAGAMLMPALMVVLPPLPMWVAAGPEPLVRSVFLENTPMPTVVAGPSFAGAARSAVAWTDMAACVWFAVAVVMFLRIFAGVWMATQLVRGSRAVENGARESDGVCIPVVVGLFRPSILLPVDWRDWDTAKLKAVLAHERAHVSRRDPLWQFIACVFRSLSWFHPLAWWLRAHIMELAEQASDDAALAGAADRIQYAETLLSFIERAQGQVNLKGVAMASARTRTERLERILNFDQKPSRPVRRPALLTAAALCVPMLCSIAAIQPRAMEAQSIGPVRWSIAPAPQILPATPEAKRDVAPNSLPYLRWLEQDVAYIVTDEERQTFKSLKSESEMRECIDQFWERRPPGMKEEHYRRIAYANDRYAGSTPGWKSDRGRIYITFGPPKEVESHPTGVVRQRTAEEGGGTTATFPYEVWRYESLPGVGANIRFEFVDAKSKGDFPLASARDLADIAVLKRTLAGLPMLMRLVGPRVYLDGVDLGSAGVNVLSGQTVVIAREGLGRIVLAYDRENDPAFTAAGAAQGRRIEVRVNGHTLRIECMADLTFGAARTVFMRYEPGYVPQRELELSAGEGTPAR